MICLFLPFRATDLCFQPMDHHVIRSSLRSFAVERPSGPLSPSSWVLDLVPRHLMSVAYESLVSQSMLALDVLILRSISHISSISLLRLRERFEPLSSQSLRSFTKMILFLASLASAKRVGELQALFKHSLLSWC